MGYLFLFRFNIHSVEKAAWNVFWNLRQKDKQIREKNPNTEKEIESLSNKLSKMNKRIKIIQTL